MSCKIVSLVSISYSQLPAPTFALPIPIRRPAHLVWSFHAENCRTLITGARPLECQSGDERTLFENLSASGCLVLVWMDRRFPTAGLGVLACSIPCACSYSLYLAMRSSSHCTSQEVGISPASLASAMSLGTHRSDSAWTVTSTFPPYVSWAHWFRRFSPWWFRGSSFRCCLIRYGRSRLCWLGRR
jgi:hypothetical protein